jgi:branched-chain amino acid transport system ATP-binding protein
MTGPTSTPDRPGSPGAPSPGSRHDVTTTLAPRGALELRDIKAAYGRIEVVHGATLSVAPSSVFALLGPNGAGKTTLLKVASGRMRPTQGSVHIHGADVGRHQPEELARAGVCAIPEGRGVFPNLTVAENLRMWTYTGGVTRSDVEERTFSRFPRLAERRKQLAGTLSGGEQQMLAMSRALSVEPRLLLLDEISMGLAPIVVGELYDVVRQLAAEGLSILVVEQFATTALSVADHAALMSQGGITDEGPPAEVSEIVLDVYLKGTRSP